jgi:hypothetical protein
VGCHADAHEQAKWFGDDIAVKAHKYRHGLGLRGAAAAMRMLGAGKPPLHRFRLGLEYAGAPATFVSLDVCEVVGQT